MLIFSFGFLCGFVFLMLVLFIYAALRINHIDKK